VALTAQIGAARRGEGKRNGAMWDVGVEAYGEGVVASSLGAAAMAA
jgi:hypothetical protein